MKTSKHILFIAGWITILLCMWLCSVSCIDEVIKFVKVYDTLYVEGKPVTNFVQTTHVDTVYRDLVRVDTVEITVIQKDTVVIVNNVETVRVDTVVQIQTDSVFIERIVEKIVNHYDTIVTERIITNVDTIYIDKIVHVTDTVYETEYEQTVVYLATTYLFPGQSVFSVPDALMPYYTSFIQDAQAHGKAPTGGDLIVQYVKSEDLPGEGWISSYTEMSGWQSVIFIDEGLLPEHSKAAMYRELSRMQLKKQYSKDVNKIMSNFFRTSPEPTSQEINQLFL